MLITSGPILDATVPTPVDLPLCVDLDGTILLTDSLPETALDAIRRDWRVLFRLPGWLLAGKARLKRELAAAAPIDPVLLAYNQDLLAWLRTEKEAGRTIVLATASDRLTAEAVATHLGLFDAVVATDGTDNLKGPAKADRLCEMYGERGFSYAGNDVADLAVWPRAGAAVVVNASRSVARRAATVAPVEREFPPAGGRLRAVAKAMRLYQWVKNLLVFIAPLAAHRLFETGTLTPALGMFLAFGLTASGIYLLNDIADLPSDRRHPRKRKRPFASGALPVSLGLLLGPFLVLAGLLLASQLGWASLAVLLVYATASTAYSLGLKTLPLVDVFMLAGLYTMRVVAGGVAVGVLVSNWLLSASGFFFLGLAFLKRFVELTRVDARGRESSRRGYYGEDAAVLQMMGLGSGFTACLVLALYISSEPALRNYAQPDLLWGIVPLATFWTCRLWLSGLRGYVHDDPIVYAARDWVSWCTVACAILVMVAAMLGAPT